jgi:hypothetical protein
MTKTLPSDITALAWVSMLHVVHLTTKSSKDAFLSMKILLLSNLCLC